MKRKIDIMGIVNLTEDSFYAGSRCSGVGPAMERIGRMLEDGADIIDLGACSTRPGSLPVGADEEWRCLEPVLKELRISFPQCRVSVDTWWSEVVVRTYDLIGDFVVNDISAGEDDPCMLGVVGRLGLEYVAMHKRGTPLTMQSLTGYEDVAEDVRSYFGDFAFRASEKGVDNWILDPGFGFAKTLEQNWELFSRLDSFKTSYNGYSPRILVGVSRKSMICKPLGIEPEDSLASLQAVHMAALIKGADILRVHDVKEALQSVTMYNYMV